MIKEIFGMFDIIPAHSIYPRSDNQAGITTNARVPKAEPINMKNSVLLQVIFSAFLSLQPF